METLTRENNGSSTGENGRFITPAASINETADGYTLELEMPGVNKEGLDISIENNELSITGHRSPAKIEGTLIHRESRSHNYRRSFEIDPSIDMGKISARIAQGVVTLTLPKAEEVKPRKITIS